MAMRKHRSERSAGVDHCSLELEHRNVAAMDPPRLRFPSIEFFPH